jgi:hypothetical protein
MPKEVSRKLIYLFFSMFSRPILLLSDLLMSECLMKKLLLMLCYHVIISLDSVYADLSFIIIIIFHFV